MSQRDGRETEIVEPRLPETSISDLEHGISELMERESEFLSDYA